MSIRSPSSTAGGWSLVELTVAMLLLGLFGLVVADLHRSIARVARAAPAAESAMARFDAILHHLRGDVWGAASIRVEDEGRAAVLADAAGHAVIWRLVEPHGDLVRTEDQVGKQAESRWACGGVELSFAAAPAGLRVRVTDSAGEPGPPINLLSQVLLAAEDRP